MSFNWIIILARNNADALASLRLFPDVQIAESNDSLWIGGKNVEELLEPALLSLPATARFDVIDGRTLRPVGSRIPSAGLPALPWQPMAKWLQVQAPVAAMPGALPERVTLSLTRSGSESAANLLRTNLDSWKQFALSAGMIRLKPLRFAVSSSGDVLVHGQPIPPLPGLRYVEREGIAVPAGYHWEPAVELSIVRRVFNVSTDALVIWDADGTFVQLSAEQFVPATRSNVRATVEGLEAAHE